MGTAEEGEEGLSRGGRYTARGIRNWACLHTRWIRVGSARWTRSLGHGRH